MRRIDWMTYHASPNTVCRAARSSGPWHPWHDAGHCPASMGSVLWDVGHALVPGECSLDCHPQLPQRVCDGEAAPADGLVDEGAPTAALRFWATTDFLDGSLLL